MPTPRFEFDCYLGDGTTPKTRPLTGAFRPDILFIKRKDSGVADTGAFRTAAMGTNVSYFPIGGAIGAQGIRSFTATGFTTGNDFAVNQNSITYCYYAFQYKAGEVAYGTWAGTSTDNQPVIMPFSPDVVFWFGRPAANISLRMKTVDDAADNTCRMDGAALFDCVPDEIQAFKSVALGDAYDGIEVGTAFNFNTIGYTYDWIIFKNVTGWLQTGKYAGSGADLDASRRTITTGCTTNAAGMTVADTGGVPSGTRFLCRWLRHLNVAPATTNWGQRFNATDNNDATANGGGWDEFNATTFVFQNGDQASSHQCNITGSTYYWWAACQ